MSVFAICFIQYIIFVSGLCYFTNPPIHITPCLLLLNPSSSSLPTTTQFPSLVSHTINPKYQDCELLISLTYVRISPTSGKNISHLSVTIMICLSSFTAVSRISSLVRLMTCKKHLASLMLCGLSWKTASYIFLRVDGVLYNVLKNHVCYCMLEINTTWYYWLLFCIKSVIT